MRSFLIHFLRHAYHDGKGEAVMAVAVRLMVDRMEIIMWFCFSFNMLRAVYGGGRLYFLSIPLGLHWMDS